MSYRGPKRRIVIDASVARQASPQGSPNAGVAFRSLNTIRQVCHRYVMNEDISREWEKHIRSNKRVLAWIAQCASIGGKQIQSEDRSPELRAAIESILQDQARRKQDALKDLPLVDAALATDRLILSHDKRARSIYTEVFSQTPALGRLVWIALDDGLDVSAWLAAGADPNSPELRPEQVLCHAGLPGR